MKKSWGAFSLWLLLLGCSQSILLEMSMGDSRIINARKWGNLQNHSYIPVSGKLSGQEVWMHESIHTERSLPAIHLSIVDSFLAVSYGLQTDLRRINNGQLIWSEATLLNCSFEATTDGFVNIDNYGYLHLLDFDGKFKDKIALPLMAGDGYLDFVRQLDGEILYSYQLPPGQVSQPGDRTIHPEYAFARSEKSSGEIIWLLERTGMMITSLINIEKTRAALVSIDRLFLFGLPPFPDPLPEGELDIPVKEVLFEEVLAASSDHDGNILVVEHLIKREDRPEKVILHRLSPEGEAQWQYSLGSPTHLSQPPASYPDGDVCIAVGSEIWRIRNGELIWSTRILAEPGKIIMTLLADGTLLAAAGSILVQLSSEGEQMAQIVIDDSITSRPIMDQSGNIYVAGLKGIRCLK